jgi:hypothetical protein
MIVTYFTNLVLVPQAILSRLSLTVSLFLASGLNDRPWTARELTWNYSSQSLQIHTRNRSQMFFINLVVQFPGMVLSVISSS